MISNLRTFTVGVFVSITLAVSACPLSASAAGVAKDVTGANAANKQFYTALNAMFKGEIEPMKNVWSHAKDVTYMGPDGSYDRGWDAVLGNWTKQSAKKLGGHVDFTEPVVNAAGEIAVVHGIEKGQNGKSEPVSIRTTNIYRKENGTWKMIGHHTDTLSWLK